MPLILEARGITKTFPGVRALDQVDLQIDKGEIHALCGENGAGKSTLMKILSGVYPPGSYEGRLDVQKGARIAVVHQELSLIPEMTVAENIYLGHEPSRFGVIRRSDLVNRSRSVLETIGLELDPKLKVSGLGIGEKQMIEIAKALSMEPSILILDEPTSALTEREVDRCLDLLVRLKQSGMSIILITHKLKEVFRVSDRITILRDGKHVKTLAARECGEEQLISLMVGRQIQNLYPKSDSRKIGRPVLEVSGLTASHPRIPHRKLLDNVGFTVREGEILGVAGLMGSGRTEMLMAIFGALPQKVRGEIKVAGQPVRITSPRSAHEYGLGLASEDRKRFGLILEDAVYRNITLPSLRAFSRGGILQKARELSSAAQIAKQFRVKTPSMSAATKNLSGGNQQKVVLSKCVLKGPRILFLDEPTRGIDVGARSEIYEWIVKLAEQGLAIVVVSSEMQEVLGLADRVLVMCEGRIT
ncbi:MAG TPA: sugar ABC transporter ATP-binding protein, partial [Bdellovibrionales bacterium]|nr:sugar ABC transporter ATP-binding protein [Bdellovibrionales bacterium]